MLYGGFNEALTHIQMWRSTKCSMRCIGCVYHLLFCRFDTFALANVSHVLLRSSLKDERNNWQQIITVIITSLRCTGSACCSVSCNVVVISELSLMTKFLTYQLIYIIPTLTCGHGLWVVTERMRLRVWTAEKGFFDRLRESSWGGWSILLECLALEVFRPRPMGGRPWVDTELISGKHWHICKAPFTLRPTRPSPRIGGRSFMDYLFIYYWQIKITH